MSWLSAGMSLVGGLLGAGGQVATNRANRDMARERMSFEDSQAQRQMSFQERMSSTAAQRAVQDYKAAGLNPALAYGTVASSPAGASGSGAQSVSSNVAEAGMSSARQTYQQAESLRMARQQNQADLEVKSASAAQAIANASTAQELGSLYKQQMAQVAQQTLFASQAQPASLRKLFSEAVLSELAQPSARAEADFSNRLGEWRPALGLLGSTASQMSGLSRFIPRAPVNITRPVSVPRIEIKR